MQLLEDEGSADEDFWNQDFFAEEGGGDVEYNSSNASESESADEPDTDFDESVSRLERLSATSHAHLKLLNY